MIETKNRACAGKHRHANQTIAEQHRERLIGSGAYGPRLAVYRCRHCSGWHVGHLPKSRRRR